MSKFIATPQHLQQIEHLVTEIPSRYVNLAQGILNVLRSFEPVIKEQTSDSEKSDVSKSE